MTGRFTGLPPEINGNYKRKNTAHGLSVANTADRADKLIDNTPGFGTLPVRGTGGAKRPRLPEASSAYAVVRRRTYSKRKTVAAWAAFSDS